MRIRLWIFLYWERDTIVIYSTYDYVCNSARMSCFRRFVLKSILDVIFSYDDDTQSYVESRLCRYLCFDAMQRYVRGWEITHSLQYAVTLQCSGVDFRAPDSPIYRSFSNRNCTTDNIGIRDQVSPIELRVYTLFCILYSYIFYPLSVV